MTERMPDHDHGDDDDNEPAVQAQAGANASSGDEVLARERMPPFSPRRLGWELGRDTALRWAIIVGAVAAAVALLFWGPGTIITSIVMAAVIVGAWAGLSLPSARVTRRLGEVSALMDEDAGAAESVLTQAISRKPMVHWLRLVLYHRLAVIRHRGGDYAQSAAICQAVLEHAQRMPAPNRTPLLLMACEARLECDDPVGAYLALIELYRTRLSLPEALQRLGLQTRYEVRIGQHAAALHDANRKVQLAELMPADQCGAVHALMATAASKTHHPQLARWHWDRTQLLCTSEQIDRLKNGGPILSVTDIPEPLG